ncbi:MAG TPA: hypothetical protein VNY05_44985 [Candidatus Acidoferrales bacterium]|nr:hypothetical protein [Candidatus Acidoferrales bacterium]
MMRKSDFEGIESAPRWILLFLGANLAAGMLAVYVWHAANLVFSIQAASGSTSALSVTGMAAVDLWLCLVVLRGFPAGAPLRSAWLLITLAAAARVVSGVMGSLSGSGAPAVLAAGGPIQLALLAAGIFTLLRVLRRFGFCREPGTADWAVSGIAVLFTLCRLGEVAAEWLAGRPIPLETWISLAGLPILCVLFLEAMLLRQSVVRIGNGLITRGWVALVCGIFLTGAGELTLWVIPHYSQTLPLAMFGALIRLPIAAAFALVPASQVAAQRRATKPANGQPEDLAGGTDHRLLWPVMPR